MANGSHNFQVHATDADGNTDSTPANHNWTVDTTTPNTTIVTNPAALTNSTSATFEFTSTEAGTFECDLDGGGFAACTTPKTYNGLAEGAHIFQRRAIDGANNTDPSPASFNWTIDTRTPNTVIDSGPANPTELTSAGFTFHSTEGGSSFQCQLDAGPFAPCTSPFVSTSLLDGKHNFQVKAVDAAGNVDKSAAKAKAWTVDTTRPVTTITRKPTDPTTSTSATFKFKSEKGSTFQCQLDGGIVEACKSGKKYTGLLPGLHTFQVQATDKAHNVELAPTSYSWTQN